MRTTAPAAYRELALLAAVYVAYALTRVVASDAFAPARVRAEWILSLEQLVGLDVERALNTWLVQHPGIGLAASYYYASAHYVVTAVVLARWWRRRKQYGPARTALVLATVLALVAYLLVPTAPPRLLDGWTDLMAVHAGSGWWGEAASAPQGLGWMTNQLAAFPSMHAGWALWVALVLHPTRARWLGWLHAVLTGVVVVGTGNHWVLDVLAGWAVVAVAWWVAHERRVAPLRGGSGPRRRPG